MKTYGHLDLFSGIGGFSLAAEAVGFRTVAFCEREKYPREVLAERWPHVPCHPDIHALDGNQYRGISLLTGGFPCQPFSHAGKMRGVEDDRYLWPEMCRLIQESQPDWVLGENVVGLDGLGLDTCIADLESVGYEVGPPLEIPACAVGAWHRRMRIWIIANRGSVQCQGTKPRQGGEGHPQIKPDKLYSATSHANSHGVGCWDDLGSCDGRKEAEPWFQKSGDRVGQEYHSAFGVGSTSFGTEPDLARMVHGVPLATLRIKTLGNAIVPQVAEVILDGMMKLLRNNETDRTSEALRGESPACD